MSYLVYTQDFGMILAHATSARLSKSKLRPHMQYGSHLVITVIKSKSRWKLIEAREGRVRLLPDSNEYMLFARVLSMLKSLIHGEEKNESLFDVIIKLHNFLSISRNATEHDGAECLALVQILECLGYGLSMRMQKYSGRPFDSETVSQIYSERKLVVEEINISLKATGF